MMMKRTLIGVLLFLAMTSWAGATLTCSLRVDPVDANANGYQPGQVITIQLYDTGDVAGIAMDGITDNPGGARLGTASNETFKAGWTNTWLGLLNANDMLLEWSAAVLGAFPPGLTGVLQTFDYTVPDVTSDITITTTNDGGDMWAAAEVDYTDGSSYVAPPELTVTLHMLPTGPVIPEPTTMLLLGLGGLLLRRRK